MLLLQKCTPVRAPQCNLERVFAARPAHSLVFMHCDPYGLFSTDIVNMSNKKSAMVPLTFYKFTETFIIYWMACSAHTPNSGAMFSSLSLVNQTSD